MRKALRPKHLATLLLVACASRDVRGPGLLGSDFLELAGQQRVGVITGHLNCRARHNSDPGLVMQVGVGRVSSALSDFLDRDPSSRYTAVWDLVARLPIDSAWINAAPGATDSLSSDPYDGDYWRVVALSDSLQAVGFVQGFVDCVNHLRGPSGVPVRVTTDEIVHAVSFGYQLDRASGDVSPRMIRIPVGLLIERAIDRGSD